jgi:hypothetical protein
VHWSPLDRPKHRGRESVMSLSCALHIGKSLTAASSYFFAKTHMAIKVLVVLSSATLMFSSSGSAKFSFFFSSMTTVLVSQK